MMAFESEFRILQDGCTVCAVSGPGPSARTEILRYAAQYSQDGPIAIQAKVGGLWEDVTDLLTNSGAGA